MSENLDQETSPVVESATAIGTLPNAVRVTLGQTFTVGVAGKLTRIMFEIQLTGVIKKPLVATLMRCLDLYYPSNSPADIIVQREISLKTTTCSDIYVTQQVNFSVPDYSITKGEFLAFTLHSDAEIGTGSQANYGWSHLHFPEYRRGRSLIHREVTGWQPHGPEWSHFWLQTFMTTEGIT